VFDERSRSYSDDAEYTTGQRAQEEGAGIAGGNGSSDGDPYVHC
jgi:hypothetical protein